MSTRVKNLFHLKELALQKRCVIVPKSRGAWNHHHPAAFVINLQGNILVRLFSLGMYVYERKIK